MDRWFLALVAAALALPTSAQPDTTPTSAAAEETPAPPVVAPPPPPPAPQPSTSSRRVLVMNPTGAGVDPGVLRTIGDVIAQALQKEPGFAVSTGRDLAATMGLLAEKESTGCTDDSAACLADIADALGASLVVSANAARLDDVLVVTLTLYDAHQQASVGRERIEARKLSSLPRQVDHAVGRMLGREVGTELEDERGPSPLLIGGGIAGGIGAAFGIASGVGIWLAAGTITDRVSTGEEKDAVRRIFPFLVGGAIVGGVVAVGGAGVAVAGIVME